MGVIYIAVLLFGLALPAVLIWWAVRVMTRSRAAGHRRRFLTASTLLQTYLAAIVSLAILFGPWGVIAAATPPILIIWLPNALGHASEIRFLLPFTLAASLAGVLTAVALARLPRLRPAALFLALLTGTIAGLGTLNHLTRAELLAAATGARCVSYNSLTRSLHSFSSFAAPETHAEAIFDHAMYYWSYRDRAFVLDYPLSESTDPELTCQHIARRFTFSR